VHFFAHKFAKQMKKPIERIPTQTMAALTAYPWPGNIRELQNLVGRAMILSRGRILEVPLPALQPAADAAPAPPAAATLAAIEREHILRVLRASNWVIGGATGASARLGLPRTTLHHKLRKLGITRPPRDDHWSPDRMRSASPLAS
jgi:formate hydrogenlyase transcriptional activator